jgi:hypothetical protein
MLNSDKGVQLSAMLVLAVNSHNGQYDKGGNPYILHPLRVMHRLRTTDEELQCIAIGHDVVEDCGITYAKLRQIGFSNRVIEGITCLTKLPGESAEEYEQKVLSNWDSICVKLEDVRDNSDIRRLKGLTDRDLERVRKYHGLWTRLKAVHDQGYAVWEAIKFATSWK